MSTRIRERNQVRSRGFTPADNWIIFDNRISDGAKLTYLALRWCARGDGQCFPGQGFLSKARGKNERRVRDHIKQLEDVGLITVVQRGLNKTNEYWIEDINDVYGDSENRLQPSRDALGACWPVAANLGVQVEDDAPGEGWKDRQAAEVERVRAAGAAMSGASDRAKSERTRLRDKRAKKTTRAAASQVTKQVREDIPNYKPQIMASEWKTWFKDTFSDPYGDLTPQEFKRLRTMALTYSVDAVRDVMIRVLRDWQELVDRFDLEGPPSIGFIWGYRRTLFHEHTNEAIRSRGKGRAKMDQAEHRGDDEYEDDIEKTGW
jgi:hypothetical protein